MADIVDKSGNRLEKFAALSYPGMLPGLAMGCNYKGIAFTVNTLVPKETFDYGTRKNSGNCRKDFCSEIVLSADPETLFFQLVFS